jgi:hypothetical protein
MRINRALLEEFSIDHFALLVGPLYSLDLQIFQES